jgi:MFS family permease
MPASSLRTHADFNKLWFGQTVSNLGDKISRIALPTVAILVLHGNALNVGVLGALRFLPFLLLGVVGGLVVDRLPRRSIMIVADIGRLIVIGTVPLAFATHLLTMMQLYVVAAAAGVLTVFFEISYQAYMPDLVGRELIGQGNQRLQTTRSIAEVAGSALGGVLIQVLGSALALLVDAASFVVSVFGLVAIKHREPRRERSVDDQAGVRADAGEGLALLLHDPRLRGLMLSTTFVNLGSATANTLLLVYAYTAAKLSPGVVGAAYAVGTCGMILGAVLATKVAKKLTLGPTLITTAVLCGLSYLLLPLLGTQNALIALMACQAVYGVADSIYGIHVMTLVQSITPPRLMGRVGGTALSVVWGSGTFGSMIGGLVGSLVGLIPGIIVGACLIVGAAIFLVLSPVRAMRWYPPAEEPEAQPVTEDQPSTPA